MPPSHPLRAVPSPDTAEADTDPQLMEEIERALDDFRDHLPDDALAALREELLAFATGHPAMKELWLRARPRIVPESSGFVPTGE